MHKMYQNVTCGTHVKKLNSTRLLVTELQNILLKQRWVINTFRNWHMNGRSTLHNLSNGIVIGRMAITILYSFFYIKAAFDSVDRCALWKVVRSKVIPDILVDLMSALHEHAGSKVRHGLAEVVCSVLHYDWCQTRVYTLSSTILCGNRLDSRPHDSWTWNRHRHCNIDCFASYVCWQSHWTSVILQEICPYFWYADFLASDQDPEPQHRFSLNPMRSLVMHGNLVDLVDELVNLGSLRRLLQNWHQTPDVPWHHPTCHR